MALPLPSPSPPREPAFCSLLAAPSAKGLFNRAIVQSGLCQVNPSLAEAEKSGADFAAKLGCGDPASAAACLRDKPADAVLDAWPPFPAGAGAAYGTKLLPLAPMQAFASGDFTRVPILVGFAIWYATRDMPAAWLRDIEPRGRA